METAAEEIVRLKREIAERQARLNLLVLGDQRIGVPFAGLPPHLHPTAGRIR